MTPSLIIVAGNVDEFMRFCEAQAINPRGRNPPVHYLSQASQILGMEWKFVIIVCVGTWVSRSDYDAIDSTLTHAKSRGAIVLRGIYY